MLFLSQDMIKEAEKKAMENVSSLTLIENAAQSLCEELKEFKTVRIYCGKGNNGSDGYATALLLKRMGIRVEIVQVFPPHSEECVHFCQKAIEAEIPVITEITYPTEDFECVVDAVFGIGICGEITDERAIRAIEMINLFDGYKLCCDIPSGMNADTGEKCTVCVCADKTVTFTAPKRGMLANHSVDYCGEIVIKEVGIPVKYNEITQSTCVPITKRLVKAMLPKRRRNTHKGTFGTAVIVAGSKTMPGAAAMAALAAQRSGCGMVKIIAPVSICSVLNIMVKEAIVIPVSENNGVMNSELNDEAMSAIKAASSVLVGCGIGKGNHYELVSRVLDAASCPVIIDADGINALQGKVGIIKNKNVLITPHPKEFSRISGYSMENIQKHHIQTAERFARENGVSVLLKGARTVVAYGGQNKYVSIGATSALSKAGSGDVLAGIIVSLTAQGLSLTDGAAAGCLIHTGAGFIAEERLGAYSVTSSDLIDCIPYSIKEILG